MNIPVYDLEDFGWEPLQIEFGQGWFLYGPDADGTSAPEESEDHEIYQVLAHRGFDQFGPVELTCVADANCLYDWAIEVGREWVERFRDSDVEIPSLRVWSEAHRRLFPGEDFTQETAYLLNSYFYAVYSSPQEFVEDISHDFLPHWAVLDMETSVQKLLDSDVDYICVLDVTGELIVFTN